MAISDNMCIQYEATHSCPLRFVAPMEESTDTVLAIRKVEVLDEPKPIDVSLYLAPLKGSFYPLHKLVSESSIDFALSIVPNLAP